MPKKADPRFALWTFYAVMVLEILFMISPAALYFYSAYGPALNLLHASDPGADSDQRLHRFLSAHGSMINERCNQIGQLASSRLTKQRRSTGKPDQRTLLSIGQRNGGGNRPGNPTFGMKKSGRKGVSSCADHKRSGRQISDTAESRDQHHGNKTGEVEKRQGVDKSQEITHQRRRQVHRPAGVVPASLQTTQHP